jgi:hypothetical protein
MSVLGITLGPLLIIVGSLFGLSGLIIAKKPDAKKIFDQVAPAQGIVGVVLLVVGLIDLIRWLTSGGGFGFFGGLFGAAVIACVFVEILLGAILGFSLVAKLIPGESPAEKKGGEIVQKLVPLQVPIGIVGLVAGLIVLFRIGLPSFIGGMM